MKLNTFQTITMTRGELYEEAWSTSVLGLSEKYNLNYDKLLRLLRAENIPHPGNSYLMRARLGQDVSGMRTPLPGNPNKILEICTKEPLTENAIIQLCKESFFQSLTQETDTPFLSTEERSALIHIVENYQSNPSEEEASPPFLPEMELFFDAQKKNFSQAGLARAQYLLSTLLVMFRQLGTSECFCAEKKLLVEVRNVMVPISITEHSTPKKLAQGKTSYFPQKNGRLTIRIGQRSISDKGNIYLEYNPGEILLLALKESERIRIAYALSENRTIQEDNKKPTNVNVEQLRLERLCRDAEKYSRACSIRDYVNAMEENHNSSFDEEWAEWALAQADSLDPTIS